MTLSFKAERPYRGLNFKSSLRNFLISKRRPSLEFVLLLKFYAHHSHKKQRIKFMNNSPADFSSSHNSSQGLFSSSIPTTNRILFVGSRDPPTTLSKNQYMLLAWHQINQQTPNLSVTKLEQYYAQYEMACGEYLLNLPLEFQNPPLPPAISL